MLLPISLYDTSSVTASFYSNISLKASLSTIIFFVSSLFLSITSELKGFGIFSLGYNSTGQRSIYRACYVYYDTNIDNKNSYEQNISSPSTVYSTFIYDFSSTLACLGTVLNIITILGQKMTEVINTIAGYNMEFQIFKTVIE